MKRKIQHDSVNNQEDEDSCTRPFCSPSNAPVDKKEDQSVKNSSGNCSNEAPTDKEELTK
jgi:hypothetical protein